MSDLKPPTRTVEKQDNGAHDLDSSDDNFTDASEGAAASLRKRGPSVPITRVERVDDEPAHGEKPGTDAYNMRTEDAVPDEIEVIPEGSRSRSTSSVSGPSLNTSVPKMIVDKVDPNTPSHGEVPDTAAWELRKADAEPDVVRQAPHVARSGELAGKSPLPSGLSRLCEMASHTQASDTRDSRRPNIQLTDLFAKDEAEANAEDDFDDFEVGDDDDDDDFGGFDEGEQGENDDFDAPQAVTPLFEEPTPARLAPLDYSDMKSVEEITAASKAHLAELFPDVRLEEESGATSLGEINPAFLTGRSRSLWAQLVAPPPLQPPDWVRSRIRRLFLVSLGVPVDLDEILPASKQKKLILPSIDIEREHGSADNASLSKLKQKNGSSTSVSSPASSKSERRRRGPAPPPEFDENTARLLCSTTTIALTGLSDKELTSHVKRMEEFKARAVQTLEYWLIQKDSAAGDKEAFEAVIENLVNHAKKIRK